jgi:hypothetical protein
MPKLKPEEVVIPLYPGWAMARLREGSTVLKLNLEGPAHVKHVVVGNG